MKCLRNIVAFLFVAYLLGLIAGCEAEHMFPVRDKDSADTGTENGTDTGTENGTDTGTAGDTDTGILAATEPGLRGQYFDRYNFDDFVVCHPNEQIDFDWGEDVLPPGVENMANMSVRWEGYVTPAYSELYTFELQVDDGAQLWIDDQLVIDEWFINRERSATGETELVADSPVKVVVEYFNHRGGGVVSLGWSSDSLTTEIIPIENLKSEPCGEAPLPVLPPDPIPGTCLGPDDFNDGKIAPQWHFEELDPIGGIGIEETTAIHLTTNLGFKFSNSTLDTGAYLLQATQGDADISFRIESITGNNGTEFGLMMRETIASDAPMVFIGLTTEGSVVMLARGEQGSLAYDITGNIEPSILSFPAWVRLARIGDTFTGYVSTDGTTWLPAGTTLAFGSNPLSYPAGIALSMGSILTDTSAATGDDFMVSVGACE